MRNYLQSGFSSTPATVEKTQRLVSRPTKIENDTWSANVAWTGGDFNGEDFLRRAIVEMGDEEAAIPRIDDKVELTGEWVGTRKMPRAEGAGVGSAEDNYAGMVGDLGGESETGALLSLHGGAYWMGDPHSHRASNIKTAQCAHMRVFALRYRLSP